MEAGTVLKEIERSRRFLPIIGPVEGRAVSSALPSQWKKGNA